MNTAAADKLKATVLVYNFVKPSDPADRQGGGVAVYQRNLMAALRKAGHRVICLSSGDRYDLLRRQPRLQFERSGDATAVIVNSPVFAPSHSNFYRIATYADEPGLDFVPAALRLRYGNIEVFHFQNVEGLTAGFFRRLRAEFPESRIVVTAHNYNLVCPQVNLWFREHRTCNDYRAGRACVNCLPTPDRSSYELNIRRMRMLLEWVGVRRHGVAMTAVRTLLRSPFMLRRGLRRKPPAVAPQRRDLVSPERAAQYAGYRQANVALASSVFDVVLAVSKRTRDVLVSHEMPAERIQVSYIGTAYQAAFKGARRITDLGGGLHLCYLGYMRPDKGFYFLLETLERMPERISRRISLTFAAPIRDGWAIERLRAQAHRYNAIHIYDGYTHANLKAILTGPNLGIVPVLWEDSLPQVALEMVTHGIPILTSDRGGAQEIAGNDAFVFSAGNHRALIRKLELIVDGGLPLGRFWDREPLMLSMDEHLAELHRHYGLAPEPVPVAAAAASLNQVFAGE